MDLDRLACIDLDQNSLEGFRQFISAWLYRSPGCTLIVDPGPLSTIPSLLGELRRRHVDRLDYILLTHIHIDHAGGAGALLREYPQAKVVCHPEGIRHLCAPEKLWQGSRQVLGAVAEVYGEIVPVPAESLFFAEELGRSGVRVFLTPGHAQHHACYQLDDLLFAGEVAGVRCPLPEAIFMRPATPPRFMLPVALASIDRMLDLEPRTMVFAHYGLVETAMEHLHIGRRQLLLWVKGVAASLRLPAADREEALLSWLLRHDEIYRNVSRLPADIFARERQFFGNTVRGMSEYVAGLTEVERQQLSAEEEK